jgi:CubicO group peptidase (beta-lactamase class C family)
VRFAERWLILPIRFSHSGKVMVMSQNPRSRAAMLIHTVLICGIAVSSAAIGSEALPPPTGFLFWTPAQQRIGYRNIEKIFPTRIVKRGSNVFPLISNHSNVDVNYRFQGSEWRTAKFMKANSVAGLLVIKHGKIVLERYGLAETSRDRWTSFSVGKSVTSTLIGAAIKDGYIKGLDSQVTDYLPRLKGTAYDGVTIRHLLTMTSGAKWNEDYSDPKSDVNQFALSAPEPDGENPIVAYMAKLPREAPPGVKWVYKTGESDLIGVLLARATHKHPADYLSEKIWSRFGMESDAVWMLDRAGAELGGCCISMTLRDYGRFGLFFMRGGNIGGISILPDDWIAQSTRQQVPGYGFQWWVHDNDTYEAIGIFGQAIFINPNEDLIIVTSSAWPQADEDRFYEIRDAYFSAVTKALHSH